MQKCITIRLVNTAEDRSQTTEISFPKQYNSHEDLVYNRNEFKNNQQKTQVKKWSMSGLCILAEEGEIISQLSIAEQHIAIICQGGTVQISKRSMREEPSIQQHNTDSRFSILFSVEFFATLFHHETWINKDQFYEQLMSDRNTLFQYFIEPPIKNIIDTLLDEHIFLPFKRYYFELKIKELIYLLLLQSPSQLSQPAIPAEVQQKLIAARAYLLSNYRTSPTTKQLSRVVLLNEFKLKYFFKLKYGITIKSYIIDLRMKEAKLLLSKGYSVNDATARLGYKNVSHFILIFKRTFGLTPKEMTKKNEPCKSLI